MNLAQKIAAAVTAMNLAQKIVVAVTLLVVVVFLLAGGHQVHYSGSTYHPMDFGNGHTENYSITYTNWPRTLIDLAIILAAGGVGVLLFRSKGTAQRQRPDRDA